MTRTAADDLAAALDRIALTGLASGRAIDDHLGALVLRPHQHVAVQRLMTIMSRHRGALLADAVGLGKTYVALAIAREYTRPLVICPAALRSMWERASALTGVAVPIVSIESLSRGEVPPLDPDVVIVDEAHHLRTPTTRRYDALARLARGARLLLLSATPLHNSRRDLTSVLALFLGSAVEAWTDRELASVIVRRDEHTAGTELPLLDGPHTLAPAVDDDCLDAICALPPAVPAADEGTAGALAAIALVHLWASSRAALHASLRKRRARAIALRDAIGAGHLPTSADLSAWHYADEALQLAFPFCVAEGAATDMADVALHLDDYVDAVSALLASAQHTPNPDASRATLLRALRTTHLGARIVAFSQYAHTVTALGRLLHADAGVAVVTADGARIASGGITRDEVLAQFAGGAPAVPAIERIDLLLSTDLLSEGVDLRGASVIVHLDLPWNPARLEQRVGRARRFGSPHDVISVYTLAPPVAAERMLALERRLRAKVRIAEDLVGASHPVFATPEVADGSPSAVSSAESLRASLGSWLDPGVRDIDTPMLVAAAGGASSGWIAAVYVDGLARLIYSLDRAIGEDPLVFRQLADSIGDALPIDPDRLSIATAELDQWIASRHALIDVGLTATDCPPTRAALDRLARIVARTPRHHRATVVAASRRARASLASVSGVGAERVLADLVRAPIDDADWIRAIEMMGKTDASPVVGDCPPCERRTDTESIRALVLLTLADDDVPRSRPIA